MPETSLDAGESELLARSRSGDEAAFRLLYERSVSRLKGRIRARIGPKLRRKVDASDILQDAYLVALERLPEFVPQDDGGFDRWLGRIVELRVRETLRRYLGTEKRDMGRELSTGSRPHADRLEGRRTTPSQRAMGREAQERVLEALERMPTDYRAAVRMIQEQHLPVAEGARRMGRSEAAFRKLYERGLAWLSKDLGLER